MKKLTVENCSVVALQSCADSRMTEVAKNSKLAPLSRDQQVAQLVLRRLNARRALQQGEDTTLGAKDSSPTVIRDLTPPDKSQSPLQQTVVALRQLEQDKRDKSSKKQDGFREEDEAASCPGFALSLAHVTMNAQDLIHVVNYLSSVSLRLRSVSLVGLETPAGLAKKVTAQLLALLQKQPSLIELQISDACKLGTADLLRLQAALDINIQAVIGLQQKKEARKRARLQDREHQKQQDEMDFFYWENSNRLGIIQLQLSQRKDSVRNFYRQQAILAHTQQDFTSALNEQTKLHFLEQCKNSKHELFSAWFANVYIVARCRLCLDEEAIWRDHAYVQLFEAVDSMHAQKREGHRSAKIAQKYRTDTEMGARARCMLHEKIARNKMSGEQLGYFFAFRMLAIYFSILPSRQPRRRQSVSVAKHAAAATKILNDDAAAEKVVEVEVEQPQVAEQSFHSEDSSTQLADQTESVEVLGKRMARSMSEMKKRLEQTGTLKSDGEDLGQKIIEIVRAKSLASNRLSHFVDLVGEDNDPTLKQIKSQGAMHLEDHVDAALETKCEGSDDIHQVQHDIGDAGNSDLKLETAPQTQPLDVDNEEL